MRPKALILAEGKLYQKTFNDTATIVHGIFFTIGFVTWLPFVPRWPSDKAMANHEKYAVIYCSYVIQGVKIIVIK